MKDKIIGLTPAELRRLLIADCRYGYTRNNHLMPSAAYDEILRLLEEMREVDSEAAIRTAEQLAEECISDQLAANFYDGLDDEFGNRKEAIDFIEKMIGFARSAGESGYEPYNKSLYEACVENGKSLRYDIFRLEDFDFERDRFSAETKKTAVESGLSLDDAADRLFGGILKSGGAAFNKIGVKSAERQSKVVGNIYRIIRPAERRGEIYCILASDAGEERHEKRD